MRRLNPASTRLASAPVLPEPESLATMTLTIFQYAIWPYEELHRQAWAASLVLLLVVLLINVTVRLASRSGGRG